MIHVANSLPIELVDSAIIPVLPVAQSLLFIVFTVLISIAGSWTLLFRPRFWALVVRTLWQQRIAVCGVIAVAALGVVATQTLRTVMQEQPVPMAESIAWTEWTNRGGPRRTGCPSGAPGPDHPGINWSAATDHEFLSSPAVSGRHVIALGSRAGRGRLFCWDQKTGEIVWTAAIEGLRRTFSSPVVTGEMLIVGEGVHETSDARVLCIDLRRGYEGQILWEWRTSSHVESTPVVAEGKVFANAGDDGVYCFHLQPQASAREQLIWHVPGEILPDAETCLAYDSQRVFVGLGEHGRAIAVLDSETGRLFKKIATKHPVFGTPAIDAGRLYVGTGGGSLLNSPAQPGGAVMCLDLQTLEVIWTFPTGDSVMGAVVVGEEAIHFCSADGTVFRVSTDGEELARWTTPARLVTSPALSATTLYVVAADGVLTALRLPDLTPDWNVVLGQPGVYVSSPVIAGDRLFLGTPRNGFLSIGHRRPVSVWKGRGGSVDQVWSDRGPVSTELETQWVWPSTLEESDRPVRLLAVTTRELIVQADSSVGPTVLCLDNRNDRPPFVRWRQSPLELPSDDVAVTEHLLVGVLHDDGSRRLGAWQLHDGHLVWQRPIAEQAQPALLLDGQELLVQFSPQRLTCLSTDNVIRWEIEIGGAHTGSIVYGPLVVTTAQAPGQHGQALVKILAVDRESGIELWSTTRSGTLQARPLIQGHSIVLVMQDRIERVSLIDGSTLQQLQVDSVFPQPVQMVTFGSQFFLLDSQRRIWSFAEDATGTLTEFAQSLTWNSEIEQLLPTRQRLFAIHRDRIGIVEPTVEQSSTTVFTLDERQFAPHSKAVLLDGRIYAITIPSRLVCLGAAGERR